MLDKDGDGVITGSDLASMLHSLGRPYKSFSNISGQDSSSLILRKMLSSLNDPLDFPAFLTYITSLKSQISSRTDLTNAFISFDENDGGFIDFEDIKNDLITSGAERLTEGQVNMALGGFVEKTGKNKGKVSYVKFLDAMIGDQAPE
jgi:Ca2+-binding EF-hand superfamily protein